MTSIRHDLRPLAFLAMSTGLYALYWSHQSLLASLDSGAVLSLALFLDLALFIPGLFYVLVVRPRGWPPGTVLPVVTCGVLAFYILVPEQQRASLPFLMALPFVVEGALLIWIVSRAAAATRHFRAQSRNSEPVDVLGVCRTALQAVLGPSRASEVLAYEMALLYYALASWSQPLSPPGDDRFTCYRRCGYSSLLLGLGLVVVCEEVMLHLLLHTLWSSMGAWVVTACGIYGLFWFFGDWQALRRRPLELKPNALELRVGLRWDVVIPYDKVTDLRRLTGFSHPPVPKGEGIDVSLSGTPGFELTLCEPVIAQGVYGLRRELTRVRFQVDDPEVFESRLRQKIKSRPPEAESDDG